MSTLNRFCERAEAKELRLNPKHQAEREDLPAATTREPGAGAMAAFARPFDAADMAVASPARNRNSGEATPPMKRSV